MNPKHRLARFRPAVSAALFVLIAFTTCIAQKPGPPKEPVLDYGRVVDSRYINDFFGFQLAIPKDWVVNGEATKKRILEQGRSTMDAKDKDVNQALDDSARRTSTMLIISKVELGAAATPSFICAVEKLPAEIDVATGADYLAAMKNIMKYSNVPMTVEKDVHPEKLGGVEFSALGIRVKSPNGEAIQTYYAYVAKGYSLTFISTYFDPADQKILAGVLASIAFQQSH